MTIQDSSLTTLIGSRICHDLISPLGAIGNGIELLQMSGLPDSPEMALIVESVQNANQRIRFFRIAFGAARDGQYVSAAEINPLLAPGTQNRKMHIHWQPTQDQPRPAVKLIFLLCQCFESAMPWGGDLRVSQEGDRWLMHGSADKLKIDKPLWALLDQGGAPSDIPPAQVQFALIAPELARQERQIEVELNEDTISVRF